MNYDQIVATAYRNAEDGDKKRQQERENYASEQERQTALAKEFLENVILPELTAAAGSLEARKITAEVGNGKTDGRPRRSLMVQHPFKTSLSSRLVFEISDGTPGITWSWGGANMGRLQALLPDHIGPVIEKFIHAALQP